MRILFVGCVKSSERFLQTLISLKCEIVGLVTKESSTFNSDFVDLAPLAKKHQIPIFFYKLSSGESLDAWIKDKSPDIIFCWGWSHLLSEKILKIPPLGVVGFHPSKLPQNRGRHPIVWALVLGLSETASTFFYITPGIDDGDIISQKNLKISYEDNAETLYKKILDTGEIQIREFIPLLESGKLIPLPQDKNTSNSWRKRGPADSLIDFRMNAKQIYFLVRALTKPYLGADVLYKGLPYKVWQAEVDLKSWPDNFEPGKVLSQERGHLTVKCADGAIKLIQHDLPLPLEQDDYII